MPFDSSSAVQEKIGFDPSSAMPEGQQRINPIIDALKSGGYGYADEALLNAPSFAIRRFGGQPFVPQTFPGKVANVAGRIGGFVTGLPEHIGEAAVEKAGQFLAPRVAPYIARAAEEFPRVAQFGKSALRGATKGAVAFGAMTPQEGGFLNPQERLGQAKTGAEVGGALGALSEVPAIKGTPFVGGKRGAKFADELQATFEDVPGKASNIFEQGLKGISKERPDITVDVGPKIKDIIVETADPKFSSQLRIAIDKQASVGDKTLKDILKSFEGKSIDLNAPPEIRVSPYQAKQIQNTLQKFPTVYSKLARGTPDAVNDQYGVSALRHAGELDSMIKNSLEGYTGRYTKILQDYGQTMERHKALESRFGLGDIMTNLQTKGKEGFDPQVMATVRKLPGFSEETAQKMENVGAASRFGKGFGKAARYGALFGGARILWSGLRRGGR